MKTNWQSIKNSSWYVKLTSWEFYPMFIVNTPTIFFWLYFGIRSKSLFFFSSVNPVIETGGVLGESKINILQRLPLETIPSTLFFSNNASLGDILKAIDKEKISYPLIAKPNIGERGFLVEKIYNKNQLSQYLNKITVDFIVQEFIDFPTEISVLYSRMPDSKEGKITSLCIKKTLTVTGDGISTIEALMEKYPRARFQLPRFKKDFPELILQIPGKGTEIELEPIGNHCRGTTFLNGNDYINKELEQVFDKIALKMNGIYYGRFDMKCMNLESLQKGKSFKILEFNGVASEPAHIYDPSYSVLQAYKDIFQHWKIIYQISIIQKRKGIRPMTIKEAYRSVKTYFQYMKSAKL